MKPLEGRVALVTGSGRGIGRAIALRLAELGADVAINYRRNETAAEDTVAAIEALDQKAKAYRVSVAECDACEQMISDVVADFGSLGILVNNAGIASRGKTVEDTDPKEFERVVHTHAFSAFYLSHFALPHLRAAARGDIIMITSTATRKMAANGAPYNVGKAAMEALAQTLSKEVNRDNVFVNTVAPGLTVTEMGDRLAQATRGVASISELDAKSPFGHVSVPEEVAKVVGFLCSPDNTYVTGQKVTLDGGEF
jgi:NAD(P)-dependent dehydrogenase (short-subunit alcohol dehydrogenase family)